MHNVYMVFENKEDGEYVPTPGSFCGCENGAFFCSHMLCFLYIARIIQVTAKDMSQEEIEEVMPEDRRVVQNEPCPIENILIKSTIKRQEAQTKRQAKKRKMS